MTADRSRTRRLLGGAGQHFEVAIYVYMWLNASILAVIAGHPWLGAVGLVTVVPFVVAYTVAIGRRGGG